MIHDSNTLISDLFKHFFAPRRLAGKPETERQYLIQLGHFDRFLGRPGRRSDFNDETVAAFVAYMADGRSAATANKARSHILSLWRALARKRLVEEFPDVPPLPEPRRIPLAWLPPELQQLFAACPKMKGQYCGVPAGLWWKGAHWVWIVTGERKTAVLSLVWDHFDLGQGWLHIPAELRKGKQKDMIYKLRPEAVAAIEDIRLPKRRMVFPFPYHVTTFYAHYKKLLVLAGLPTDRRSKPQRLRRSFASYLEAKGGNATEALDHSSRAVTKRSYLDPRIVRPELPPDFLPPLDPPADAG